ncbi:ABC transporter ATP-binding protein [Janibacter cremeus]|uniref:Peptide/nickel transport system ATP-binding protein n=1 Tax=Janibacter cremeus TaxID=1285192 RepID=A0A852VZQ2_9MICO|nr:ABC transporter ATP-binding protein [Janibacter cremeus]NYF98921.1 peptide/nickel transport system ATP-binding protein [Janibacter cremeus]
MSATSPASTGTDESVLSIQDLQVTFATDQGPVEAVKDVNLEVAPGEVLAIVGESGSGKTVTARTVLGLLAETASSEGAVLVGRHDVLSISQPEMRRLRGTDVAMIFQEPSTALNPVYKIGWQIIEGLRAHDRKLSKQEARDRTIKALTDVGIPDAESRIDYYPHQFSGGQKQRIMIAMALALNPGLIIADEPTTALDVTVQAEILELLRDLRDRFGSSIVLITHNMGVVADLADRVAVMYQGELVEEAPAAELFAHPREDYTKKLLAAVPHLGRSSVSASLTKDELAAQLREPVVVRAKDLVIEYPGRLGQKAFRAVDGVSFEIHQGEVLGLVGESGSGKTTIGRAIAGLNRISRGSLSVLDHEMLNFRERAFMPLREQIGFVFQDPAASFNPHLTVGECVAEPLAVHRSDQKSSQRRARVEELLEAVQLPRAHADRYPHELSGGQRQRASLARALALDPRLLVADEPTSALDVSVQAAVLELFKELQDRFGFACLFISHDLAVVDILAHRIGVLYRGELVEQGIGTQVLQDPQDPYTQRLIASLPVPDPQEQAIRREKHRQLLEQEGGSNA